MTMVRTDYEAYLVCITKSRFDVVFCSYGNPFTYTIQNIQERIKSSKFDSPLKRISALLFSFAQNVIEHCTHRLCISSPNERRQCVRK